MQQRLLGFCMRALEDTPTLPAGLLNQAGTGTATFRGQETVQIVRDKLSIQDLQLLVGLAQAERAADHRRMSRAWCRSIREIQIIEGRPVQTRVFEMRGGPA